ncbi:MAG TPA: hypothetical protein VFW65_29840 [Pseudonocardiaceae bacterium]|nr:hypothetical protein [Pseudonocardiaceae bacterium]
MNHVDGGEDGDSPSQPQRRGYPELVVDFAAAEDQRIILADEFGQQIRLSPDQLLVLVSAIGSGVLDLVLSTAG